MNKKLFTYKKSGVNINAADKFVNFISNISSKKQVIIENFALLFVSVIIGLIVSGVAQILIIEWGRLKCC